MRSVYTLAICFTFAFVNAQTSAAETDQPKQDPEWFACRIPADCALVEGHCGRHNAVNREFKSKHIEWLGLTTNQSECVTPSLKGTEVPIQASDDLKVGCRDGQCIVQEDGLQRAR